VTARRIIAGLADCASRKSVQRSPIMMGQRLSAVTGELAASL
jgi:hypothetical protein